MENSRQKVMCKSAHHSQNAQLTVNGTTIEADEAKRYSLNDLHQAAGGEDRQSPRYFMRSDGAKDLVKELEAEAPVFSVPQEAPDEHQDGDEEAMYFDQAAREHRPVQPVISNRSGPYAERGTFVCKELVYAYAMWLSPKFQLQVIRAYDRLVTLAKEQYHLETAALRQRLPDYPGNHPRWTFLDMFEEESREKVSEDKVLLRGHVGPHSVQVLKHRNRHFVDVASGAIVFGLSMPQFQKLADEFDSRQHDNRKFVGVDRLPELTT